MLHSIKLIPYTLALLIFSILALTSCDSTSDDGSQSNLTLQFQTNSSSSSLNKVSNTASGQFDDTLRIDGNNGTLKIDDIRFIVEEFELERSDGECEDLEGDEQEGCEEFEADPFFVDLPLDGELLNLDTSPIQAGLYEKLEFEVENLDFDEEDTDEDESKQELRDQVRSAFPDWPESASMVITGTFADNEGNETPFKTFAEAEVEIELEFSPPLEVGEDTINRLLRINIDPARWFTNSDGSVTDLSQHDFDSTGSLFELEVEIENGFLSVEVDDEDDTDNDDD